MHIKQRLMFKSLGSELRKQREQRGIHQEDAAKIIGITRAHLSNIERGEKTSYSVKVVIMLCDVYNIKTSDIFKRAEESIDMYSE